MLDFESMINNVDNRLEFEKRIGILEQKGYQIDNIKQTVNECLQNIYSGFKSFVIYGEP